MNVSTPISLSLSPFLRCPACRKGHRGITGALLTLKCERCGAHWWATWFEAGDIRAQVLEQFGGDPIFVELLDMLDAPTAIDQPMYWQLRLTGHQHYRFTIRRLLADARTQSIALVRSLLSPPAERVSE